MGQSDTDQLVEMAMGNACVPIKYTSQKEFKKKKKRVGQMNIHVKKHKK